ncbi:hypothetical protein B0H13DRAFT_1513045, partial [Mycena leptocephala]
ESMVPNLLGDMLPRKNEGDREYYCCTMLVLFKPWRSGEDLKIQVDNWHKTYTDHTFTPKALKLMKNFNVRYECNDARDDFSVQDRQNRRAVPSFGCSGQADDEHSDRERPDQYGEECLIQDVQVEVEPGPKYLARERLMKKAEDIVTSAGWINRVK